MSHNLNVAVGYGAQGGSGGIGGQGGSVLIDRNVGIRLTKNRPRGKRWCYNAITKRLQSYDMATTDAVTSAIYNPALDAWDFLVLHEGGFKQYRVSTEDLEYYPAAHPQIRTTPTHEGDPMALRHEFTFDYTGAEIAKAIDVKITDIKAKIKLARKHDLDGLIEAGLIDASKKASVESSIKSHEDRIETWEAQKRPYLKSGTKKFSLDSDDVAHFGL